MQPHPALRSDTVLVVEDDPDTAFVMRRLLFGAKFNVEIAGDVRGALESLAAREPQIVLADLGLPDGNGLQVLRESLHRWPDTPRFLVTGMGDFRTAEAAVNDCQVSAVLQKPWRDDELVRLVRAASERRALERRNRELLEETLRQKRLLENQAAQLERKVDERTALLAKIKEEWVRTFDAIDHPISILNEKDEVVRANLAFAQLTGLEIREVIGQRCYALLGNRDERCERCPRLETVSSSSGETARAADTELTIGERSFVTSVFPWSGCDESRVVCIYRETTGERRLARQLLQTEKLAAIGQLAAGVAHEINNPLGAIIAFVQLMKQDAGRSSDDEEALQLMEHAALRCKSIVDGLLRFTRRPAVPEKTFDLNKMLQDAILLFGPHLKRFPHATLRQELSKEPLLVRGDSNQIEQVALNLLMNGVQALEKASGEVRVSTSRADSWVELRVQDTGRGIRPEHRNRLFEPLFTTKAPGEGTGLGLAISRTIVESHGGTIDVESRPGEGATFKVQLPLRGPPPQEVTE